MLAQGCAVAGCAKAGTLLAVTDRGGVAERSGGLSNWRLVLADAPWIGQDGKPVNQSERNPAEAVMLG